MININDALKRKVLVTVWCVCSSFFSCSQDSISPVPRHAIKFSPLHLLNPEVRSVQLAYEYRFSPKFSVQLEGGYVFGDMWWSFPSADVQGIKLKEDLRWYFHNKELTKRSGRKAYNGMYLAMELHQNRMTFIRDSDEFYRQNGVGIKSGFVTYAPFGFVLDLNVGLTYVTTNMEPLGIPLNNTEPGANGYHALLPIIGVRLGYWIE